jgi:prolyl-tRNA editing enzyme YbaK/EbsC (Cys-tRNA(Pro) deacylase)
VDLLKGPTPYNRVMLWPEPVERVAAFLRETGAECRLEELGESVTTPAAAAEAIGCAPEQVAAAHVYVCDRRPVLALVPGNRRADAAKVAGAVGSRSARPASTIEVEAVAGPAPGAVTALGLSDEVAVLVETMLLASPVIWAGAGSERHLAMLAPAELVRLTRGLVVDLVPESA